VRCSSCEMLLDRYVEGTLPAVQMATIARHLKDCKACSAMLVELRVVDALLATTKSAELAPNFTFAVMAEARSLQVPAHKPRSLWSLLAFYLIGAWIVACAAFVLGSFTWARAALAPLAHNAADAFAAVAGVAHGFSPAFPLALALGLVVLIADGLLVFGFVTFYRALRPRLLARLARSEAL
jgi:anti-sigma factor RsiW